MPSPSQTLSPAGPHLYEEPIPPEQSSPLSWLVTALFVLSFILPFFFLYQFRRMSRITRTGLCLLPWAPAYLISLRILFTCFPALNPCPPGYYPGHFEVDVFAVSPSCHWLFVIWNIFFLVFFPGIGLLCLAGIVWLVRLRHPSA